MKLKTNSLAKAVKARRTKNCPGLDRRANEQHLSRDAVLLEAVDLTHPDMERRLRAQRVWEFLDEGKSKFYARMKIDEPSYDPLFPSPIPSSSTGNGHKRWKFGDVVAWLRHCEALAKNS